MKKLSQTEAETKRSITYKKKLVFDFSTHVVNLSLVFTD